MQQPRSRSWRAASLSAAILAAALGVSPGVAAARSAREIVLGQAPSTSLDREILTTPAGRTLYSLSAETAGHFICTGSCLSLWHPLVLSAGASARGPVRLGRAKRPDGRMQVTFAGRPLYSFSGDTAPGEINGEGLKDVGTWQAAGRPLANTTAPPNPQGGEEPPYPSPPASPPTPAAPATEPPPPPPYYPPGYY